jgi:hypothetical protein
MASCVIIGERAAPAFAHITNLDGTSLSTGWYGAPGSGPAPTGLKDPSVAVRSLLVAASFEQR